MVEYLDNAVYTSSLRFVCHLADIARQNRLSGVNFGDNDVLSTKRPVGAKKGQLPGAGCRPKEQTTGDKRAGEHPVFCSFSAIASYGGEDESESVFGGGGSRPSASTGRRPAWMIIFRPPVAQAVQVECCSQAGKLALRNNRAGRFVLYQPVRVAHQAGQLALRQRPAVPVKFIDALVLDEVCGGCGRSRSCGGVGHGWAARDVERGHLLIGQREVKRAQRVGQLGRAARQEWG